MKPKVKLSRDTGWLVCWRLFWIPLVINLACCVLAIGIAVVARLASGEEVIWVGQAMACFLQLPLFGLLLCWACAALLLLIKGWLWIFASFVHPRK